VILQFVNFIFVHFYAFISVRKLLRKHLNTFFILKNTLTLSRLLLYSIIIQSILDRSLNFDELSFKFSIFKLQPTN